MSVTAKEPAGLNPGRLAGFYRIEQRAHVPAAYGGHSERIYNNITLAIEESPQLAAGSLQLLRIDRESYNTGHGGRDGIFLDDGPLVFDNDCPYNDTGYLGPDES